MMVEEEEQQKWVEFEGKKVAGSISWATKRQQSYWEHEGERMEEETKTQS